MVKLYKNFNINKNHKKSIILIGNFDGVHLGHQRLFNKFTFWSMLDNLKFFKDLLKNIFGIGLKLITPIFKLYFFLYDSAN